MLPFSRRVSYRSQKGNTLPYPQSTAGNNRLLQTRPVTKMPFLSEFLSFLIFTCVGSCLFASVITGQLIGRRIIKTVLHLLLAASSWICTGIIYGYACEESNSIILVLLAAMLNWFCGGLMVSPIFRQKASRRNVKIVVRPDQETTRPRKCNSSTRSSVKSANNDQDERQFAEMWRQAHGLFPLK